MQCMCACRSCSTQPSSHTAMAALSMRSLCAALLLALLSTLQAASAGRGKVCAQYEQCGGENGKATCSKCPRGSECVIVNKWYRQCRPKGNKPSTPTPTTPTTPPQARVCDY